MPFFLMVARSCCSKLRAMLNVFRFSGLNVVFVHPLMQPVPCPVVPAEVSIILLFQTRRLSMGELWCLSFSWLQGRAAHTARNAHFAAYFPVKRRFRSSVDAAVPCPVAPAQASIIVLFIRSRNEFGRALVPFFLMVSRSYCSKLRAILNVFRISPVKRHFRSSVDAAVALPRSTSPN